MHPKNLVGPTLRQLNLHKIFISAIILVWANLQACSPLSAVPVTLKEAKDYVIGQEESFSHPVKRVLAAAVHDLGEMNFKIKRIEYFSQKGYVRADWGDAFVCLSLETITPRLTKVICKLKRGSVSTREYSSEEEFFNRLRESLSEKNDFDLKKFAAGMAEIHSSADKDSPVIGYLGEGAAAQLLSREGKWARIALMDDYFGYIESSLLKTKP